jgi:hypothetical protein
MPRFIKKPEIIEADQFTPSFDIPKGVYDVYTAPDGVMFGKLNTPRGVAIVMQGDYIITGIRGERYPCAKEIFNKTYDRLYDAEEGDRDDRDSRGEAGKEGDKVLRVS